MIPAISSGPGEFVVLPVQPDVCVVVIRNVPQLSREIEALIDETWARAQARVQAGGARPLFNGRVFSVDTITPGFIGGHMSEFRRIVAQMEMPALFADIGVRPLAVCGVVRSADGIVAGRRHAGAVYQAGMWQLPPAGSVDAHALNTDGTIDIRRQLMRELEEELGIAQDQVGPPTPLCAVEHPGSHVIDLGCAIPTGLSAADILRLHAASGNEEYDLLRVIPEPAITRFVREAGDALVPPASHFLRQAGILAP